MTTPRKIVKQFAARGLTVATAESCTGGLIAKQITDIAGSSAVLVGSFVTYTNRMKIAMLGVSPEILEHDSAVSYRCAEAMAIGALERTGVDIAVSATGYAGPGGGTPTDPVGTVYLSVATRTRSYTERFSAPQNATRAQVRAAAARRALELMEMMAKEL